MFDIRRWLTRGKLSAILVAVVVAMIFHPLGLPMSIGKDTREFYGMIEKLSPGDVILFVDNYSWAGHYGGKYGSSAIVNHVFQRGLKLIVFSTVPDVAIVWADLMRFSKIKERWDVLYGRDLVVLNYLAGGEVAMRVAAENLHYAPNDAFLNLLEEQPLMKRVKSLVDCKLIIAQSTAFGIWEQVVRQMCTPYNIPMIARTAFLSIAAYYGTRVFGCLDQDRGVAEYELLTGYLGEEVARMDSINLMVGVFLTVTTAAIITDIYERRLSPARKVTVQGGV